MVLSFCQTACGEAVLREYIEDQTYVLYARRCSIHYDIGRAAVLSTIVTNQNRKR